MGSLISCCCYLVEREEDSLSDYSPTRFNNREIDYVGRRLSEIQLNETPLPPGNQVGTSRQVAVASVAEGVGRPYPRKYLFLKRSSDRSYPSSPD